MTPITTDATEALARKVLERVAAGEIDLRNVGELLTGKWDQDFPAALLGLAIRRASPSTVSGTSQEAVAKCGDGDFCSVALDLRDEAVNFVFDQLAKALGLKQWVGHDGTETWDGDVAATLMGILRDSRAIDPETDVPAALVASPPTTEPVAYLHEIEEPDLGFSRMFSKSPESPWSHWLKAHLDKCTYTRTALADAAALATLKQELIDQTRDFYAANERAEAAERERDEFRDALATQCGKTMVAKADCARMREALESISADEIPPWIQFIARTALTQPDRQEERDA